MFTGIIRHIGEVLAISSSGTNLVFEISAPFTEAIQVDQSISHNGTCLTVTSVKKSGGEQETNTIYTITAVAETLEKTNLSKWKVGDKINLELSMKPGDRLDGHFVQGHVDAVAKVTNVKDLDGSWFYEFTYKKEFAHLLVNKGSITINGVSLTIIHTDMTSFSVTIIPYTYEHTNFPYIEMGDLVNVEFDMIGKYLARYISLYSEKWSGLAFQG